MVDRPFAVITRGEPEAVEPGSGWRAIPIRELPAEPFDLAGQALAVRATVVTDDDAADVLMAAARGCAVIVRVQLEVSTVGEFLDDLGRLVDLGPTTEQPVLDDDQVALLERLADGETVTEAARHLGWSRRTATRRLGDAKRRLGVSSTGAAVQAFRAPP